MRDEHASTIREQALSCITLPLDELLTVFNALERSTTMAEALTALFDGLGREFSRVALFAVRAAGSRASSNRDSNSTRTSPRS